jgi:hypothetical protein
MNTFQKLNWSTDEVVEALGSSHLFKQLRFHKWLAPLKESRPGRPCLYPVTRVLAVQARMEAGELPPPLPCEVKGARESFQNDGSKHGIPVA